MSTGPVQLVAVGFAEGNFDGRIAAELERLEASGAVRLLDLLFVARDADGVLTQLEVTDYSGPGGTSGPLARLVGIDGSDAGGDEMSSEEADEAAVWYVDDAIPNGSAAALVLLEHRWAIGLRDAIVEAGGVALADEWLHPLDLAALEVG